MKQVSALKRRFSICLACLRCFAAWSRTSGAKNLPSNRLLGKKGHQDFFAQAKNHLKIERTPCLFCYPTKLNPLQTVPKGLKGVKTETETGRKKFRFYFFSIRINRSSGNFAIRTLTIAMPNGEPKPQHLPCRNFFAAHWKPWHTRSKTKTIHSGLGNMDSMKGFCCCTALHKKRGRASKETCFTMHRESISI